MVINFLLNTFSKNKSCKAIVWQNRYYDYQWLEERFFFYESEIKKNKLINQGSIVILEADFTPNSIALLLVLINQNCIIVPITESVNNKKDEFILISQGEVSIKISDKDKLNISSLGTIAQHDIYDELRKKSAPGLVLFSSGSSGKSKASVHNIKSLLKKYKIPRNKYNAITFLLFDHIGGFNTLFYILSNAGLIITINNRRPDNVMKMIQNHNAELLPTTPTFINLILLSEAYLKYNISSLKIITYGTEPMPYTTLKKLNLLLPKVKLVQTYGLSEVGILRSKSRSSDSLWVKVGGEEFQTRVRNKELEIKTKSLMLGYLNAKTPLTADGWFKTGDAVSIDGDYIKILGRFSEIINVGGQKVYPQEVENILCDLDNVLDVTVHGEKNLITGNIVCAKFVLKEKEDRDFFFKRMLKHCKGRLDKFKIPLKVSFTDNKLHSRRFKKERI